MFQRLYAIYDRRFVYDAPALRSRTEREIWDRESPLLSDTIDSGIVHTLLGLDTWDDVLGHPVAGKSWEGFVAETLIRAAPDGTRASFYRTATGVEIDLVLELPGGTVWAVEIKRGVGWRPWGWVGS